MLPPSIICLDRSKHIADYRLMIYALPLLGHKISPRLQPIPEIYHSFALRFKAKQLQLMELIRTRERGGGRDQFITPGHRGLI